MIPFSHALILGRAMLGAAASVPAAASEDYAPAGDLTTGVPAPSYGAGTFVFRTPVMVLGADPRVDAGAFGQAMADTIAHYVPGAVVSASSAAIAKGPRQTKSVLTGVALPILALATGTGMTYLGAAAVDTAAAAAVLLEAGEVGGEVGAETGLLVGGPAGAAIGGTIGVIGAVGVAMWVGGAALNVAALTGHVGTETVPCFWVTITGRITVSAPWQLAALNRAIAAAFAASTRLVSLTPYYAPQCNPSSVAVELMAALTASDGCRGGEWDGQVIARACTRVEAVANVRVPSPAVAPAPQPHASAVPAHVVTHAPQPVRTPHAIVIAPPPPSPAPADNAPSSGLRTGLLATAGGAVLAGAVALAWSLFAPRRKPNGRRRRGAR